jgi:polysaccharide biosynthesis protein PslA
VLAPCEGSEVEEARQPLYKLPLDYVFASLLLILLAPIIGGVAVAVKLDSPGPVFFRQPRVGCKEQTFMIWKFRTMAHAVADIGGVQLTVRNDIRITRVGAWLRKWSLDEIPQLLNVLAGDMSLVGPRPHPLMATAETRLYHEIVPEYRRRHTIKPGITGWAQVNGWRGETATTYQLEQRVAYDLAYIEKQCLWLDLWILLLTTVRIRGVDVF